MKVHGCTEDWKAAKDRLLWHHISLACYDRETSLPWQCENLTPRHCRVKAKKQVSCQGDPECMASDTVQFVLGKR